MENGSGRKNPCPIFILITKTRSTIPAPKWKICPIEIISWRFIYPDPFPPKRVKRPEQAIGQVPSTVVWW